MHDAIFRPWFNNAEGPFEPFQDRRWGVLAYAGGLGLTGEAAGVLGQIAEWPVFVREAPTSDAPFSAVPDLATLNAFLDEPRTAVELCDHTGSWGAIVSQVDGFTLIAASSELDIPADTWERNHVRFRTEDAVEGGIGFGQEGDRFVQNDLMPLLRTPRG